MRALLAAVALALAFVPAGLAQSLPTESTVSVPGAPPTITPEGEPADLTEAQVKAIFRAHSKVEDWLERYPRRGMTDDATYDGGDGSWTVNVWWDEAGEIARGRVDDDTKAVIEAWTGPQVAWTMARGYDGAFGGKELNNPILWVGLSLVFFLGLADLRRLRSLRNLDLLALLSFGVSLAFFNVGNVFAAMVAAYPPLVYLIVRSVLIGFRGRRGSSGRLLWPAWVLAAATIFLVGFRIGLNVETSNVIDVGYAGVIGAHRIASGEAPYGHFPVERDLPKCGPEGADGEVRERVQTNGRCESANENGDTYGPVSYQAYLPGYWLFGWDGGWDPSDLPAANFTSIVWDLIVIFGLVLVGRRYGGWSLAAALPFAWAAYPFTQYVSNSNTNDSVMPAFLVWGFWLASWPAARGAAVALSAWTKLAALIVAPLWATYPTGIRRPRALVVFAAAFVLATAAAFWVLLLEPDLTEAARTFWDRTFVSQFDRESPFSLWDWGQYHAAGIPDLERVQQVLIGIVAAAGLAFAFVPRRKSPLQLAALTGALLLGFELVLTHWSYLYIPWFFPFVAVALLAPVGRRREAVFEPEPAVRLPERRLVTAGAAALGLLLVSWLLLHTSFWSRLPITDVPVYERYGAAMVAGEVPYRDFALEYPPAALAAFLVPAYGEGLDGFRQVFEVQMWVCGAAALLAMLVVLNALGRSLRATWAALAFAALMPLLLGSVVLSRFDLLPAALAVGGLAGLVTGRHRLGLAALALGAAAKVYPAVLIPPALVYVARRAGAREAWLSTAAAAGTLVAVVLPFLLVAPRGVWESLTIHATRGLQIESLGAGLLFAAHHWAGSGSPSRRARARRTSRAARRTRWPRSSPCCRPSASSPSGSRSGAARPTRSASSATSPPPSACSWPSARCSRPSS